MKNMEEIKDRLKKELDRSRYHHTIGVMYTAAALAMCYEVELEDAMLAGILHDCAKCIPDNEKFRLCEEHGIILTEMEIQNTALIHPKLGAYFAEHNYGVTNTEILDAISGHTTGHPGMTNLEKIIFIADYIEPGRNAAPDLTEIRKLAFEDLDMTMYRILRDTLNYLHKKGGIIDTMTEKTYQYYKNLTVKEEESEDGTGKTDGETCISGVGR